MAGNTTTPSTHSVSTAEAVWLAAACLLVLSCCLIIACTRQTTVPRYTGFDDSGPDSDDDTSESVKNATGGNSGAIKESLI